MTQKKGDREKQMIAANWFCYLYTDYLHLMYCTLLINLSATTDSYKKKKHLTPALPPTEAKTMTLRDGYFILEGTEAEPKSC